jgi:hypothetical protein
MSIEIYAKKAGFSPEIEILIVDVGSSGRILAAAKDIQVHVYEEGMYCPPTTQLDPAAAQKLMDQLWDCGLRPSEGSGSAGSLAATQRHLNDMRDIAKGLLKKQGVKL